MAGGSAGGDGRRSFERRSWKVGRRRKLLVDRKVGPEGWLKAQAGEQQDGWPLDLIPISVGGWVGRRCRKVGSEPQGEKEVGG